MKKLISILLVAFCLTASAGATVTWDIAIGTLRTSDGTQVATNTLWAIIYRNPSTGNLPGGLDANSSLTAADSSSILAAFSGKTIAEGQPIDGSTILLTGSADMLGTASHSITGALYPPFAGVTAGGVWGLYWFPGLTTASNQVPTDSFEIGGFTQTDSSVEPYGNAGTVIPADGATDTTFFFDDLTTATPGDLPSSRFTAVAVPETTTLTLSALGLAALLRRRRG